MSLNIRVVEERKFGSLVEASRQIVIESDSATEAQAALEQVRQGLNDWEEEVFLRNRVFQTRDAIEALLMREQTEGLSTSEEALFVILAEKLTERERAEAHARFTVSRQYRAEREREQKNNNLPILGRGR